MMRSRLLEMTRPEEYRLNAVNCLAQAEQNTDHSTKAAMIARARSWFALADQADRNSETDVVYEPPPNDK